jgi:uncharacterized pyridoxamine 5'-phosphate oxidase family protein
MPGYGPENAESAPGERVPWRRASEWLRDSRNYWVATTRPDGRPHAMPVWGVWLDGVLCFGTSRTSRKYRNIQASPEAVVHTESGDEAVIVEGRLEEAEDVSLVEPFLDPYEEKYDYRPDPSEGGGAYFLLRPRVAFSWREQDFPESATRWHFET